MLEVHTADVKERGTEEDAGPAESAMTKPLKRITKFALVPFAFGGLGVGLVLGSTRPVRTTIRERCYAEALRGSRAARTRSRPKMNSSAGS
jgi:hypothetical protein